MPFTIPNHDTAFSTNQSIWFETDVAILAAGLNGVGVVSGGGVTAQGSPDMTVAIAAGTIRIASGAQVAVTSGNGTISAADATNPRIDLVSASDAGTKTVTAGTAAASPKPPALPSGHVALAMVYVPANDTTIASDQITDKRVVIAQDRPTGFIGAKAYNSAVQSIATATATPLTLDSEDFDTDGFHSTSSNTGRMTIPAGMGGKYLVVGHTYDPFTGGGFKYLSINKNGSTTALYRVEGHDSATISVGLEIAEVFDLAAGDYIELWFEHNQGSNQNVGHASARRVQTEFMIHKLDSGKVGSGIGAKAYNSAVQNISNDTLTAITMDSEEFDTDGFHSTSSNTSRMTIPAGLGGKYLVVGGTYFATADVDGVRIMRLRKNGADVRGEKRSVPSASTSGALIGTWILDLVAGDYVEVFVYQNSGAAMDVGHATELEDQSHLAIMRLDSGTSYAPQELGYAQITADVTTTSTTMVDATGLSVSVQVGSRPVMVEFWTGEGRTTDTVDKRIIVELYDTTASAALAFGIVTCPVSDSGSDLSIRARLTPAVGARSYKVRFRTVAAGTATIRASSASPAFIRVYEV
jgi:hypothetical protein